MTRVDDILSLIDAGLGSSTELPMVADYRDLCWRCQRRSATPAMDGACEPCASWLLGEGEDPGVGRDEPWPGWRHWVGGDHGWVPAQVHSTGVWRVGVDGDNYIFYEDLQSAADAAAPGDRIVIWDDLEPTREQMSERAAGIAARWHDWYQRMFTEIRTTDPETGIIHVQPVARDVRLAGLDFDSDTIRVQLFDAEDATWGECPIDAVREAWRDTYAAG